MKIVLLTQYFPPEVGAPQSRLFELAIKYKEYGSQITILTAMPNYPNMTIQERYKRKLWKCENMNGLEILRSWIFVKKSNSVLLRLLNYFSFVVSSFILGLIKLKKHDYLICESPPLFLGLTAYLLSKLKQSKFVFNVADLWPETAEKLNIISNKFLLSLARKLELFLYHKAFLITGQSQGIVNNISERTKKNVYLLRNGADLQIFSKESVKNSPPYDVPFAPGDFVLFYGGLLGYQYSIETILNSAVQVSMYPKIKFLIVGDGPKKEELVMLTSQLNLQNISFMAPKPRLELAYFLSKINVVIISFRKLELFDGIIPAKIFDALALEKPILLGANGETKELFIQEGKCGLYFEPENVEALTKQILVLYQNKKLCEDFGKNGRMFVKNNFDRSIIAKDFYNYLLSELNPTTREKIK